MRLLCAFVALALVALPAAKAGSEGLAGNWKVTIFEDGQQLTFWLLKLESKDGKLTGSAQSLKRVPPSTVSAIKLQGDKLSFTIKVGTQGFDFEGKYAKGDKKIFGSLSLNNRVVPGIMETTTAKNGFEMDKELVAQSPGDPRLFDVVLDLIQQANKEKATVKEVKGWTQAVLASAEKYGERWQRETTLRLAVSLAKLDDLAEVAMEVAEAAAKLKGPADYQIRALSILESALKKLGKVDDAKAVATKIDKLESVAYQEYTKTALPFKVEKFPGRKGKSKRAVLIELFTGAQCPPCVAVDLAFDGTEKAYKPSEAVLLQYHLHIPGPDVLTNPDSEARQEYYGKLVRGTPTVFFNGKPAAAGGGGRDGAEDKFQEFREVIDANLEKPTAIKIDARAVRKGNQVQINATSTGLDKADGKVRLRLALVEDWVRYKGRNGLSYHSRVVRALPGGPKGLPVTEKEVSVVVNLSDLERKLSKYLDDFAKNEGPFPDAQRPMRFRDLSVVAFVQNDETSEVLQAVEVPVKDE